MDVNKIAYGVRNGFGVGLLVSVLITLTTSAPPYTTAMFFMNPFVIVFTLIGLAEGFENGNGAPAPQKPAQPKAV